MPRLILLRHGQSQWNLENRFTGWVDVDLTQEGEAQARHAGELIAQAGFAPAVMFTSVLTRAKRTGALALQTAGLTDVPVVADWRLNERHYGGLTGLDKAETAAKHGEEQVKIWRRSFDVPPPVQPKGSAFDVSADRRYAGIAVPQSESLKDTIARALPAYDALVVPELKAGRRVVIAAHGNSLRALVKHLSGISDDDIVHFEIPTGVPILYTLDAGLNATDRRFLPIA
jgi:2,3-bisphosphoglycerate-dependent phosphoglycerate mutase